MKTPATRFVSSVVDCVCLPFAPIAASIARLHVKLGAFRLPRTFSVWDRFGVLPVAYHYYQPIINADDLPTKTWSDEDPMYGVDMRVPQQLELLNRFDYNSELLSFPLKPESNSLDYYYENGSFLSGDAEILYNMIRLFRPKRIIEIGSGFSTRIAKAALDQNRREGDSPTHTCIEPYEMPWLEKLSDTKVVRSRVEDVNLNTFDVLEENDILFIDSSHVVRTGGDVCFEYLKILPNIRKGVLIHIHDIFFPYEYPRQFIKGRRFFWNEQYLLQAFLMFNREFEVLLSLNYLAAKHRENLGAVCPVFAQQPGRIPGSFWMRRV